MTNPTPLSGGTTSRFTTDAFEALLATLRRILLDYTNENGDSARSIIVERLYQERAPDETLDFPYATMRLTSESFGTHHGMRLTGTLEVLCYGRPQRQLKTVQRLATLFDQCMLCLVETTDSLILCHGSRREPLPNGPAAVDSEVVTIRLTYTLAIWPEYLTSLTRVLT